MIRSSLLGLALLGFALPALADPPAAMARPDPAEARAQDSFAKFAKGWMQKMEANEDQARMSLKTANATGKRYRGFDEGTQLQLKPTGSAKAPYVGLLKYREQTFECHDKAANDCSVVATTPVTEIFRFENGRWVY